MVESFQIGDSVLVRRGLNQVPGVVIDMRDTQVCVRLAEPYVDQSGQPQSEIWYPHQYVDRVLDDADARPELPA